MSIVHKDLIEKHKSLDPQAQNNMEPIGNLVDYNPLESVVEYEIPNSTKKQDEYLAEAISWRFPIPLLQFPEITQNQQRIALVRQVSYTINNMTQRH